MSLPRPLRILLALAVLVLLAYGFGTLMQRTAWAAVLFPLATFGGIGLLAWYGSRIRKRDMTDAVPWVPARAVVKAVQIVDKPAAAGRVAVRLHVSIETFDTTAQRTKTMIDTDAPLEAIGHFGANTVMRVLHHPTNKLLAKVDGGIPLDR